MTAPLPSPARLHRPKERSRWQRFMDRRQGIAGLDDTVRRPWLDEMTPVKWGLLWLIVFGLGTGLGVYLGHDMDSEWKALAVQCMTEGRR